MRWLVLAAMLGAGLAGCLGHLQSGADPPKAFVAEYDLESVREDKVWLGRLRLELKPPVTIADEDGTLRSAYVLESRQIHWLEGEAPKPVTEGSPAMHYLDSRMLLARTDSPCPDHYICAGRVMVDWSVQGAPAPFGVAWRPEMRIHVEGKWKDVDVQGHDGLRLPAGTTLPFGMDLSAELAVQMGPDGVAESFVEEGLDDPASPYDRHWTRTATRSTLTLGEDLPAIEPWPMRDWGRVGAPSYKFLPGEQEEAFGMGITFRQAYDELLNRSESANSKFTEACGVGGFVYWGGGGRSAAIPLGGSDEVALDLFLYGPSDASAWEIRYGAGQGPIALMLGHDGYDTPEPNGHYGGSYLCQPRFGATLTPQVALQSIWAMDLASGVPCGLHFGPLSHLEAGSPAVVLGGLEMGSWLFLPGAEENQPWGYDWAYAYVSMNAASGGWASWLVMPEDLIRLDSATIGQRAPPSEPRDLLGQPGYRCVPPQYKEGPLAFATSLREEQFR